MVGLANYKAAGQKFMDSISNYVATLKNVIISDGITVTEWHCSFDHKQAGPWNRVQVSVQRWKDGKIVHERHHYNK